MPRPARGTAADLRHARRRWRSPHARGVATRRSHGQRTLNNPVGWLRSLDVDDYPAASSEPQFAVRFTIVIEEQALDLKPIAGLAVMLVASLSAQRLSPIRVEPSTPTVNVGASVALRAIDDNGQVVAAKWAISDPLVATVSAQGVLTGRNPGRAVVQARSKNSRGETTVTVRAIEPPLPTTRRQRQRASSDTGWSASQLASYLDHSKNNCVVNNRDEVPSLSVPFGYGAVPGKCGGRGNRSGRMQLVRRRSSRSSKKDAHDRDRPLNTAALMAANPPGVPHRL